MITHFRARPLIKDITGALPGCSQANSRSGVKRRSTGRCVERPNLKEESRWCASVEKGSTRLSSVLRSSVFSTATVQSESFANCPKSLYRILETSCSFRGQKRHANRKGVLGVSLSRERRGNTLCETQFVKKKARTSRAPWRKRELEQCRDQLSHAIQQGESETGPRAFETFSKRMLVLWERKQSGGLSSEGPTHLGIRRTWGNPKAHKTAVTTRTTTPSRTRLLSGSFEDEVSTGTFLK